MYQLVQYIRNHCRWGWILIDKINAACFATRYGRRLRFVDPILEQHVTPMLIRRVGLSDLRDLCGFFREQPAETYTYFNPHGFTYDDLLRQFRNKSFLMFVALDGNRIVGYCFLRCFANGKAFRGKIVDYRYRNRGIAKQMGIVTTQVATVMGLRMFGTISRHNYASMHSSEAVNEIRVIRELPDDYLYIEYLSKH